MRPPVALGSSPELLAFTMSLAPPAVVLVFGFFFLGFESTQLARRVHPKRTQMEVQ